MQNPRYCYLLLVVVMCVFIGNPCKRLLTIRSRANQIAKLLMDQKETNPSEEVISLPMKRRRAKKRGCILFRKKLQERRSIAIRMKRRSLECSRKQQKRNQLLVKERRGRSKSKENTEKEIFFEGDLKLNDNQKESLTRKAGQESTGRKGRGALKNVRELWPGGLVKYHLSNNIWTQSKEVIRATLRDLQSKLGNCIRFQEIDTGNRIFVKWSPYRSWSWYGYQGNVQNLELKSREFTPGVIQHEFLHAVGLLHTQARMDRDNYIQIIWDNIHPDDKKDFNKHDSNHFGLPYDFHSLMHYGQYACNICGYGYRITIKTHDPKMQSVGK